MKTKLLLLIPCFLLLGHAAWAQGNDPVHDGDPEEDLSEFPSVNLPTLAADVWVSYCPSEKTRIPKKGVTEDGQTFNVGVYTAIYDTLNQRLVLSEINTYERVFIGKSISPSAGDYYGYLLKATSSGTYHVKQSSTFTVDPDIASSVLKGNPGPNSISTTSYDGFYFLVLLANSNSFVQFVGDFPPNKAFFVFPTPEDPIAEAPSIRIVEESEVVTTLDNSAEEAKSVKILRNGQLYIRREGITYDLMGRTVR